jgi:hypothetical protein
VKPDKPAREDFFLHVLHASDAEKPAALPKVELQDEGKEQRLWS